MHRFLVDAYSAGELSLLVEQWDRDVAGALPSPRAVSLQEYAHALVEEVWRRRTWTGEDGLLAHLVRSRARRIEEIDALRQGLDRLCATAAERTIDVGQGDTQPVRSTAGEGAALPTERTRLEVVATSSIDLLLFVHMRLCPPADEFWAECEALYRQLLPAPHSSNRLRLRFEARHVIVDSWPHLVRDGQILSSASVALQSSTPFYYCPRGRATPPEYRLEMRGRSFCLSGTLGPMRYSVAFETPPSLRA